jgi:hypothetical protein
MSTRFTRSPDGNGKRSAWQKEKAAGVFPAAFKVMAPQVGLEPTTLRLTAECSAIELLRNTVTHGHNLPAVRE